MSATHISHHMNAPRSVVYRAFLIEAMRLEDEAARAELELPPQRARASQTDHSKLGLPSLGEVLVSGAAFVVAMVWLTRWGRRGLRRPDPSLEPRFPSSNRPPDRTR